MGHRFTRAALLVQHDGEIPVGCRIAGVEAQSIAEGVGRAGRIALEQQDLAQTVPGLGVGSVQRECRLRGPGRLERGALLGPWILRMAG